MTKIFAVLNLSPESPQKDAYVKSPADAIRKMEILKQTGADYVDVGARSSFAKSEPLDDAIELERLASFFAFPRAEGLIPLSLDTWSAMTACSFLTQIDVLNYTSTYFPDKLISDLVSTRCKLILNYLPAANPYELREMSYFPPSTEAIFEYFKAMVARLEKKGVQVLAIDPNLGMWHPAVPEELKPVFQREIIEAIPELKKLAPVFIVAPRTKGVLNVALVELILSKGIDFLRTHDLVSVKELIDQFRCGAAAAALVERP
jgi:dihydropteroate synthase